MLLVGGTAEIVVFYQWNQSSTCMMWKQKTILLITIALAIVDDGITSKSSDYWTKCFCKCDAHAIVKYNFNAAENNEPSVTMTNTIWNAITYSPDNAIYARKEGTCSNYKLYPCLQRDVWLPFTMCKLHTH